MVKRIGLTLEQLLKKARNDQRKDFGAVTSCRIADIITLLEKGAEAIELNVKRGNSYIHDVVYESKYGSNYEFIATTLRKVETLNRYK